MKPSITYSVEVQRSGYIRIEPYFAPEVAPTPTGHARPARTVGEVKGMARSMISWSGMDAQTKRAAREAVRYLTLDDCIRGRSIAF